MRRSVGGRGADAISASCLWSGAFRDSLSGVGARRGRGTGGGGRRGGGGVGGTGGGAAPGVPGGLATAVTETPDAVTEP
ncbi:hypothetical protein GFH48_19420 [Streptomyces fagopyri]|uniref:Uncharacterized protein n=1 Tax=Streptomyces fagopyri TaxID=2662397 RepID=A0A5Q0LF66_9ACTN|nr:hypothetical protein GFH48_19420 [Streptomyces fagopyri]